MFPTWPQQMASFVQFRSITPSILSMPFHVCRQVACPNGCIATLVAFIWLFAAVCFQMTPQRVREAPFNKSPPLFGHCPNSIYTPPPALKRALCGTFFQARF